MYHGRLNRIARVNEYCRGWRAEERGEESERVEENIEITLGRFCSFASGQP